MNDIKENWRDSYNIRTIDQIQSLYSHVGGCEHPAERQICHFNICSPSKISVSAEVQNSAAFSSGFWDLRHYFLFGKLLMTEVYM
jgi:hypothetical protein